MDEALAGRVAVAAAVLRRGGIVIYPTETLYGLGARADDGPALERLAQAKLRPEGKPLPLIAADLAQVDRVAVLSGPAARVAARLWPGPLTLVLPARAGVHPAITAGSGTVGVRIPGSEIARALAAAAGAPLVSTSANPSGGPPPSTVTALDPALVAAVDHVLDGGATPGGAPSTVVEFGPEGLRVLRAGAVDAALVAEAAR